MFIHKFYKCSSKESMSLGCIDRYSFKKNSKLRSQLDITLITSRTIDLDNQQIKLASNELFFKLIYKKPVNKQQEKSLQRFLDKLYLFCFFETLKDFESLNKQEH